MEAVDLFVRPQPLLSSTIEHIVKTGELRFTQRVLERGDFLFQEGDDVRSTFYIQRGMVRLYSNTPDGCSKTVFFHKAGTLIGFQWLQRTEDCKLSILNARATTTVEIFEIDATVFDSYLRKHGDLCYAVSQYLFEMMALQTREAVNAAVYPVLHRFAALLLTIANELGAAYAPAIVPFSNDELAEMLGVHVNSITNSVCALRKVKCVERQRGALVITDFKKLKSVAEDLIVKK
ncbi:Crp/Fnr family transcriptional regulator [Slackia exigua]|uniref:Crp/Fnr family transcriptional regulator n=1 Tax=Slackia exigua TaxID=84109 RepID=UPI002004C9EC|nr:Crp/Fnr family transcriptional regulator [Slackia exigua]